jgi:hypothetical protein
MPLKNVPEGLTPIEIRAIICTDRVELGTTDTKEGGAMKKHWLGGLVFGVSVALLLAGGVALAEASMRAWPECFQCLPEEGADGPYYYNWESCGWEPDETLYYRETFANGQYWGDYYTADEHGCIADGPRRKPCRGATIQGAADVSAGYEWVWPDDYWGPFELCASIPNSVHGQVSADQIVCDTILFAEVCEPEFVPEPGSIMLLVSGLAGLAGYATLRWRARE